MSDLTIMLIIVAVSVFIAWLGSARAPKWEGKLPQAPKCPPAPDKPTMPDVPQYKHKDLDELKHLGMLRQGVKPLSEEQRSLLKTVFRDACIYNTIRRR